PGRWPATAEKLRRTWAVIPAAPLRVCGVGAAVTSRPLESGFPLCHIPSSYSWSRQSAGGVQASMQIWPAIDLRGGKCVRLQQGDYGREKVFADDPAQMARLLVEQGAEYLHLVDL